MSDANLGSAAAAGSPSNAANVPANGAQAGQTVGESKVDPAAIKNLESLVGRQGEELGEYRKFFGDIAPLLDKLDKSPEIVQAILGGNITADLAKAALEGKVKVEDAKVVTQAHEEVKKDLGQKGYATASPEQIQKLVEDKVSENTKAIESKFDAKLKEQQDMQNFEKETLDFISRTPDFQKYSEEIDKWLDEHDVDDIAVAYYAVKGELSEKEAKKLADEAAVQAAKDLVARPAGGSNRTSRISGDSPVVDSLIGGRPNPNVF